ncbi:MAG: hypothetical protein IT395_06290 [Candidatus Omnitrophica bacterium]|nr:hypothetical protein [Candidatus Omnitrophota bacterium]
MQHRSNNILLGLIAVPVLYWLYLACVTQPVVVYDAQSYVDLAVMINQKGWQEYFISGPNREPIYPFLVALSMRLAGIGSYVDVLKCFQFVLLLASVSLFVTLLMRSAISRTLAVAALLYFGFSPAITNSAFSLFSEGATYSFILGMILMAAAGWKSLHQGPVIKTLVLGLAFGAFFVGTTMIKGIYEMIFPLILIPFIIFAVKAWQLKKKQALKNTMVFLLATLMIFVSCVYGYKALNKKYNGLFVLTDRAGWVFYGAAARREMPLNVQSFGAAVAYDLFEEDGCKVVFPAPECEAWHVRVSEALGAQKNYEVIANFSPREQNAQLFKGAIEKILENPFQYVLLTALEWTHMFFWETTQIGFVVYPDWLDAVFGCVPFAKVLRFIVGALSLAATLLAVVFLWKNRKDLWAHDGQDKDFVPVLFFAVYVVLCHVTLYSLFAIVPRHAVPIGPALILIIAFVAQRIFNKNTSKLEKEER